MDVRTSLEMKIKFKKPNKRTICIHVLFHQTYLLHNVPIDFFNNLFLVLVNNKKNNKMVIFQYSLSG